MIMEFDQLKDAEDRGFNPHSTDPFTPFVAEVPRPPEYVPGTVLGFTKQYSEDGPAYSFAAVHVRWLGWYLTGPQYAGEPMRWDDLLDFIGGPEEWRTVGVVAKWTPLVP